MAGEESVGAIVVRLIFQTDAGKVLGEISGNALAADKSVDQLAASGRELSVSLNTANPEIQKIVQGFQEASLVSDGMRTSMEASAVIAKDFAINIRGANTEMLDSVAPMQEATVGNEAWRNAVAAEKQAEIDRMEAVAQSSRATKAAATSNVASANEELGALEALLIARQDLMKAMQAPGMSAQQVQAMSAELVQVKRQINEIEGKGFKNLRKDFNDTSFEIRRGQQALFALTFLLTAMNTDNASQEQQKYTRALTNGATAAIGITFALQAMGPALAAIAGPVGIGIGALLALISIFNKTDEAAKKASEEGLKEFADLIKQLSEGQKIEVKIDLEAKLKAVTSLLDEATDKFQKLSTMSFSGADSGVTKEQIALALESVDLTDKQRTLLSKLKDDLEDQITIEKVLLKSRQDQKDILQGHLNTSQFLVQDIKEIQEALAQAPEGSRLVIIDKLNDAQRQLNKTMRGTDELQKDAVKFEQARVDLGRSTLENVLAILQTSLRLSAADDTEGRLAIEKQIADTKDKIIALDEQRFALGSLSVGQLREILQGELAIEQSETRRMNIMNKIAELGDKEVEATNSLRRAVADQEIEMTGEVYEKKRLQEEKLHQDNLDKIQKKADEAIKAGVDVEEVNAQQEKLFYGERDRHTDASLKNEFEKEMNLRNLRIQNIVDEKARKVELFQFERDQLAKQKDISPEVAAEKIKLIDREEASFKLNAENELMNMRVDNIRDEQDRIEARYALEVKLANDAVAEGKLTREQADEEIASLERNHQLAISDLMFSRLQSVKDGFEGILDVLSQYANKQKTKDKAAIDTKYEWEIAGIERSQMAERTKRDQIDLLRMRRQREINDLEASGLDNAIVKVKQMLELAKAFAVLMKTQSEGKDPLESFLNVGLSFLPLAFGLSEGGKIPGGSFVVNEKSSEKYSGFLDALGAREVTGGVPHTDSVVTKTDDGETVVLTPGERILPARYAALGSILNEDRNSKATALAAVSAVLMSQKEVVVETPMIAEALSRSSTRFSTDSAVQQFQKSIVARNGGGMVGVDDSGEVSQAVGSILLKLDGSRSATPVESLDNIGNGEIVSAIARLDGAIRNVKIEHQTHFHNLLEGQRFLEKHLPDYVMHENNKTISAAP